MTHQPPDLPDDEHGSEARHDPILRPPSEWRPAGRTYDVIAEATAWLTLEERRELLEVYDHLMLVGPTPECGCQLDITKHRYRNNGWLLRFGPNKDLIMLYQVYVGVPLMRIWEIKRES